MMLGDDEAAGRIWQRYSPRLAALARERLPRWLRSVVDGDDIANSAFLDVVVGARAGRFPRIHDRDDLWGLLACITVRKVINQVKKAQCQKRPPLWAAVPLKDNVLATDRAADLQRIAAEQLDALLERLRSRDEILRSIALWKFEGYTNAEVARRVGCTSRRIARKLELIRMICSAEVSE
jgi:DNA-directed RNA polymerase specialized sigma24 family protein